MIRTTDLVSITSVLKVDCPPKNKELLLKPKFFKKRIINYLKFGGYVDFCEELLPEFCEGEYIFLKELNFLSFVLKGKKQVLTKVTTYFH